jgi:exonuclease VII large subunit
MACVVGEVSSVFTSPKGTIFVHLDGEYPHEAFNGVVFASDASVVALPHDLAGKRVEIHGKIKMYDGKAEIIVKSASQVRVVEPGVAYRCSKKDGSVEYSTTQCQKRSEAV